MKKLEGIRKAAVVVSVAVGSVLALAGNSTAATVAQPSPLPGVSIEAGPVRALGGVVEDPLAAGGSTQCDSFVNHGKKWTANCKVIRGQAAAWTECSDGTEIKGPFVGVGYWKFGGDCSGHGTVKRWKVLTK
ncbi:hypothetical protein ACFV7Q_11760 [Streptomyces sp. NPDC059851]|uniref:hypothetical protein n=1 Tax=Streptomyces sp. NPDC059851 TaxID=3346971 RepID=UPI00364C2EFA